MEDLSDVDGSVYDTYEDFNNESIPDEDMEEERAMTGKDAVVGEDEELEGASASKINLTLPLPNRAYFLLLQMIVLSSSIHAFNISLMGFFEAAGKLPLRATISAANIQHEQIPQKPHHLILIHQDIARDTFS